MDIVNGTSDDAKVKVSGGGSGTSDDKGGRPRRPKFHELDVPAWDLHPKVPFKPPDLPPLPWHVLFAVGGREVAYRKVTVEIEQLKLTKVANNGYKVEEVKPRTRSRRKVT